MGDRRYYSLVSCKLVVSEGVRCRVGWNGHGRADRQDFRQFLWVGLAYLILKGEVPYDRGLPQYSGRLPTGATWVYCRGD